MLFGIVQSRKSRGGNQAIPGFRDCKMGRDPRILDPGIAISSYGLLGAVSLMTYLYSYPCK
jgi:hypothetical protein